MQRSSLLRIIIFIIAAMLLLSVAFIAVLFSIVGRDMYSDYKIDELLPKAKIISQQVSRLYREHTDKRTVARMVYSGELSVADAATYIIDPDGDLISNDSSEDIDRCRDTVLECLERVMNGETFTNPRTSVGLLTAVPIYGNENEVIGAVVLVQRSSFVISKVNDMARTFGIVMIAALLLTLIPTVLLFRSVTKPIKQISDVALSMAKGDLSMRAEVRGSYESQHLAESFNTLAEALQNNIEYLIIERNRLNAILDGIGEGIIAVDRTGTITHYNTASVSLLGGAEDAKPQDLPDYARVSDIVSQVLKNDKSAAETIVLFDRVISVIITPIHEDNDVICGAVALLRDVTESERLEQTRRDYVANVSHELRTPLASIRSLADALNDGMVTEESDRRRYYGYILKESIRLSRLIDDLLELSRLQSGGVAFTKMRVELYDILFDVADRMNEAAQQRGRSVQLNVPEGEYFAFTNSDRVEQVLIALTDNAIKHGVEGCRVDIDLDLTEDGSSFLFSISNPADVDPADLEHIFERFYKADRAHTGEGTGLGLAIVLEVLNLLDEKIRVSYENGIIRFRFTVRRDKNDCEHPELKRLSLSCPGDIPRSSC